MADKGTVLVTGASRGIGAACVRLLVRDGYDVAVNYARSADAANQLVDKAIAAGRKAIAIKADVGVEADVERMFDTLDAEMPPLAGLINNAGILFAKARVDEMGPDRINDTLRINVTGSFMCARQAIRRMSTKHGGNGGSIVNLSSAAARLGAPNEFVDYAASKGRHRCHDAGACQGGRCRGDPRQCRAPGPDLHRHPCLVRPAGPG
jgi:NAD(P)-dependent dehydrogenase (short-subunit alcohol dehydrogenase family)